MAGHRRISTELFLEYANDPKQMWKVSALVSLDHDHWVHGQLLPERRYADKWKKSRSAVRRLVAAWKSHGEDLYLSEPKDHPKDHLTGTESDTYAEVKDHRKDHVGKDRLETRERPQKDHPKDHLTQIDSDTCSGLKDHLLGQRKTKERPHRDHILEPEPEQERRETSPLRSPSARKTRSVAASESRLREMLTQVEAALAKAPTESQERRAERKARLETLGEMFLACSRVPDEAQLRVYFRSTSELPTGVLEAACDAAIAATDGTFHPDVKTILAKGNAIFAQARKRARKQR